ncbi:hypothetical protein K6V78_09735 [Streptococcus gallolyticus]|nr:hypothetical protein [Streptococcus gallolyticus]MBY5041778.1 hypothetical protein [Streptococcus gallolyticus]
MTNSNWRNPGQAETPTSSSEEKTVTFEIVEHVAVLNTNTSGWTTELNRVSWNGKPAKYEIRDWNPDHTRGGKGTTFDQEVWENLKKTIKEMN